MSALWFLFRRTLRNWLRELKKHPGALISYIVLIALLALTMWVPSKTDAAEQGALDPRFLRLIALALYALVLFSSVKTAMGKGHTLFRQADVHFAFPSPISSNHILFYGLIRQMGTSAIASLFILYQIPNIQRAFGVRGWGIVLLMLSYCAMLFTTQIMSMFVYVLCTKRSGAKRWIARGVLIGAVALALWVGGAYAQTQDIMQALSRTLFAPWAMMCIPFAGWATSFGTMLVDGSFALGWIGLALLIVGNLLCIYYIVHAHADYYEDVLQSTESAYQTVQDVKEGRTVQSGKRIRLRQTGLHRGWGASAFYHKHLLEQRRRGKGFVDARSLTLIAVVGFLSYTARAEARGLMLAFSIGVFLLFFTNAIGPFHAELSKPYIFLAPLASSQKVLFGILSDLQKSAVDGVLAFALGALLAAASPWEALACMAAYVASNLLFMGVSLLSERVLGKHGGLLLQMVLYLVLLGLLLAPGIVACVLVSTLSGIAALGILCMGSVNLLLGLCMVFCCRGVLHNMEMAGASGA